MTIALTGKDAAALGDAQFTLVTVDQERSAAHTIHSLLDTALDAALEDQGVSARS